MAMSVLQPRSEQSESRAERASRTDQPSTARWSERELTDTTLFRIGRGLFGGLLAFMAVDNFRTLDETIGYAESKGAPMPRTTVPAVSSSLLVGSLGLALWRAPVVAASAVAAFFATITPVMHDFWAIDDAERRQQQQIHFLKNLALLGASLVFAALGRRER